MRRAGVLRRAGKRARCIGAAVEQGGVMNCRGRLELGVASGISRQRGRQLRQEVKLDDH